MSKAAVLSEMALREVTTWHVMEFFPTAWRCPLIVTVLFLADNWKGQYYLKPWAVGTGKGTWPPGTGEALASLAVKWESPCLY